LHLNIWVFTFRERATILLIAFQGPRRPDKWMNQMTIRQLTGVAHNSLRSCTDKVKAQYQMKTSSRNLVHTNRILQIRVNFKAKQQTNNKSQKHKSN